MTNKEAIRILKIALEDSKEHIRFCFDSRGIEALDMAIKSLEAEPCEDCDCISREDAINAVKDLSEHYANNQREFHPHIDFVVERLEELSSVTPHPYKGESEE